MKKFFTACPATEINTFASIPTGLGLFDGQSRLRRGAVVGRAS